MIPNYRATKLMNKCKKKNIIFKSPAPYFQKQNNVFKKIKRTIIDITRATILKSNINNKLWPELVFAMAYIKNS